MVMLFSFIYYFQVTESAGHEILLTSPDSWVVGHITGLVKFYINIISGQRQKNSALPNTATI
jgi:hypothetical protein